MRTITRPASSSTLIGKFPRACDTCHGRRSGYTIHAARQLHSTAHVAAFAKTWLEAQPLAEEAFIYLYRSRVDGFCLCSGEIKIKIMKKKKGGGQTSASAHA